MQIKIEKLFRNDRNKEGLPYIDKNNKPYQIVQVYQGEIKYSAIDSDGWTSSWAIGGTIDVEVEDNEKNGMVYHNIKKPSKFGDFDKRLKLIEDRLARLESGSKIEKAMEFTQEAIKDDDLPF